MAHWRPLEAYTPFGQMLVEFMWAQRPPLLPAQFAAQMGVRKQALSSWLTSDATPAPQVVVRLARTMGLPVADLLIAAGHATPEDPLVDTAGAWELVFAAAHGVLDVPGAATAAAVHSGSNDAVDATPPTDPETLRQALVWLAAVRDACFTVRTDSAYHDEVDGARDDASGTDSTADASADEPQWPQ